MQSMVVKQACIVFSMPLTTQGERIDHALRTSKTSVATAAKECDVSAQSVYAWVRGDTKNLRAEHLFALAELTGFEARWIATGKGPERPIYRRNPRAAEVLKAMESLPEYLVDKLVDDARSLSEIAEKIKRDGTNG